MTSFNTQAGSDSGGGTAATGSLTIPAGVLAGDVVLVVSCGFNLGAGATLSASSTGTAPVLLNQNQTAGSNNGLFSNGGLWWFTAASTDPGKVITFTPSAGVAFWANALAAYSGAGAVDVHGGVPFESTTGAAESTPALTTGVAGDWAVYLAAMGTPGGALAEPAGTTSRIKQIAASFIAADICDSNASVGGAGTGIGGAGKQYSATNGNTWYSLFTVGLAPPAGPVVTMTAAPPGDDLSILRHMRRRYL